MDAYYYNDAALQAMAATLMFLAVVSLVIGVLCIVALWKIFNKAGIAGWKSLIPFYNTYCLCKITWGTGWVFLAYIVPVVNVVIAIITQYRLAKVFGKGIGFTLGLIFLSPFFLLALGFGSAEYDELPSI
jgi:Na+/H+-translocating membrane pyrophosphatase